MNPGNQGNMHFNLSNNFSPAHMSQQNMQPQQGMMQQIPQHSPMGQQITQQMPQQMPQQMNQQIPQQMGQQIPQQMMQQQPQPQMMQQQLIAQQQQMMAQQQQMPQQGQQQMLQQQQMNPQQQMVQQQMPQQQMVQQQMPQIQMPQQQMAQQQMPMTQQQPMMPQQQGIFQHPQQHSPAPQQVMHQQQQFIQQQMQQQQQQPQQQQQQKDFNPASLCRIGQETVQELVSRVQECLQLLKNLQPPNGSAQSTSMALDKKNKLDDQLKTVKVLFKRLRIVYNKCNENSQELDSYPLDTMVPTQSNVVDWKYSDRTKSDQYLAAVEEKKELYDQILVKNRHLQDIMEYMRSIIWEVNTMLMMRRP